jgi:anthranilate synthase/aminodeoxychorismate synthase-like glutamine amidotransferase
MRLLLVDNFDSFVYNLAQAFGALGAEPVVIRNDAPLDDLRAVRPDAVVISPGPGAPDDAGVSVEAVTEFGAVQRVPVLGVCLGHQCIGAAFGGRIERARVGPVHGKTSEIRHDNEGIFSGLPSPFMATRYHSLALGDDSVPTGIDVSATSDDGTIMGIRHQSLPINGVQFHPESVLTDEGPMLMRNFLDAAGTRSATRAG